MWAVGSQAFSKPQLFIWLGIQRVKFEGVRENHVTIGLASVTLVTLTFIPPWMGEAADGNDMTCDI